MWHIIIKIIIIIIIIIVVSGGSLEWACRSTRNRLLDQCHPSLLSLPSLSSPANLRGASRQTSYLATSSSRLSAYNTRMPSRLCSTCEKARAVLRRPKTGELVCRECFYFIFEEEVHQTIVNSHLFRKGERVAIGASGGKDSTVLAHVIKTLNDRYGYGLDLFLLSIDEGITGYRDDSLETVKRNKIQYGLPLKVLGYDELYGWSMDEIVKQVGTRNNCTFCGVFRRQALDRGAASLGVDHIITGHNADDMAETVLMNVLRGDIARLERCTDICTQGPTESSAAEDTDGQGCANVGNQDLGGTGIRRSKPFKYAYEKEIVM